MATRTLAPVKGRVETVEFYALKTVPEATTARTDVKLRTAMHSRTSPRASVLSERARFHR
jgi:hypothetical protein